jgi:GT2 family glycosyltransferase
MQVGSGGPRSPEIVPPRVSPGLTAGETPAPTISCIIPTLERGEVLCDMLRMLFAQTHPAHEIIVVDQTLVHSTAAYRTLSEWVADGRILWLRQREPNASSARNLGARAATGDVVLFLDDDIRIRADFLATYVQVLQRTGAAGVSGPVLDAQKNMVETLNPKAFTSELGWLLHFRKNYARACETSFMMSGNVAIRRELFLALGGMDENYERGAHREESDFAVRFRQAGYRFRYDPRSAIYHLGPAMVPGGGARARVQGKDFRYFHHCVGDWYFNLKFCTARTAFPLLVTSLRHFVFTRQTLERPWRFPLALGYWLLALPPAIVKRCRGAKLLCNAEERIPLCRGVQISTGAPQ